MLIEKRMALTNFDFYVDTEKLMATMLVLCVGSCMKLVCSNDCCRVEDFGINCEQKKVEGRKSSADGFSTEKKEKAPSGPALTRLDAWVPECLSARFSISITWCT